MNDTDITDILLCTIVCFSNKSTCWIKIYCIYNSSVLLLNDYTTRGSVSLLDIDRYMCFSVKSYLHFLLGNFLDLDIMIIPLRPHREALSTQPYCTVYWIIFITPKMTG